MEVKNSKMIFIGHETCYLLRNFFLLLCQLCHPTAVLNEVLLNSHRSRLTCILQSEKIMLWTNKPDTKFFQIPVHQFFVNMQDHAQWERKHLAKRAAASVSQIMQEIQ